MLERPQIGVWLFRTDPYWVQVNAAVYMRGQQLPVDLIDLEPTMELSGGASAEPDKIVEDILSFGLSALIAAYIPDSALLRILNTGLPVVHLSETRLNHPNLVSIAGYYASALLAGQFVAEQLKGRGRVLVIGGLWGADVGDRGASRITAIDEVIKKFPGLTWKHIPAPWGYEDAYPVIQNALITDSDSVDAIIGISDSMALAAQNAGRLRGEVASQTIIVGINGDPLALASIAEGNMTATIESDAARLGSEAMDIAYLRALGQSSVSNLDIHPTLVTAENVGALALKKLISIADIPSHLVGINRETEQLRANQLEIVTNISQQISGLLDRQKLFDKATELIQENYQYTYIQVYRWIEPGRVLLREYPHIGIGVESEILIDEVPLVAKVMLQGESIFIPDTLHSLQYPPDPAYPQTRSRAVLPIRYNQKVVGALDLHSSQQVRHLRHELLGLQLLADQIGIIQQNVSLYEKAIAAQALAEKTDQFKTRLLANVSHELRAPINLILGYSQLALKEPDKLHPSLRSDLEQIHQSGEHQVRLINDLLDMSRLEIGALDLHPDMIEPRSFLENVFKNMVDSTHQKEVVWRLDLPESLPLIQADSLRLRQILLNLLSNASKFTQQGEITLGAEVEPPHLHFWVSDTGAGILPDEQEHIFEPFFRAEQFQRRREGIGLGLSITRRLVALHNGSMTLESKIGEGSTFHIYLPLPGLTGPLIAPPLNAASAAVLFLISHSPSPSTTIVQLSQRTGLQIERITSIAEVNINSLNRPGVLAWDLADAHPNDWALITELRRFPHLCRLPFIVYNQNLELSGLTNVLTKPVAHNTLMEVLDGMRPVGDGNPILIVDDDPKVREMLGRLLQEAFPSLSVQSAADGQMALEMLESFIPGLVVLDLVMPRMDGFTFLEKMRQNARCQSVPVLIMSGKLLTEADVRRLDYVRVVFQSKEMLEPDEAIAALRGILDENARLPQSTSVLVKQALAYIHQNYAAANLSRQQIASAVGVSERYLSDIFKQEMGLSPWDVLNRFRIQRAQELLKSSDTGITEIATQVGFDDSSYFGRVFRKQTGFSPRDYRKH